MDTLGEEQIDRNGALTKRLETIARQNPARFLAALLLALAGVVLLLLYGAPPAILYEDF